MIGVRGVGQTARPARVGAGLRKSLRQLRSGSAGKSYGLLAVNHTLIDRREGLRDLRQPSREDSAARVGERVARDERGHRLH
jgi:hypothetical protein